MFSDRCLQFVNKKKNYGENSRYRENICKIGRSGGCCSNWEPPDQIGRVGMFVDNFANDIHVCLRCYGAHLEQILERQ